MALGCVRVSFLSLLLLAHAARKSVFSPSTSSRSSPTATLKSDSQTDTEDSDGPHSNVAHVQVEALAHDARKSIFSSPTSSRSSPTATLKYDSQTDAEDADVPHSAVALAAEDVEVEAVPASFAEIWAWVPDRVSTHISQDVEYHGVKEEMLTFPMRRPRVFNVILATIKTCGADMLAQFIESRQLGLAFAVNWRRSLSFAVFGLVYVGLVQWFLLVTVMSFMAPHAITFSNMAMEDKMHDFAGQVDLVKQVLIDNMIFGTFIYFPVFYTIRELVTFGPQRDTVSNALRKYYKNMIPDNLTSMIWIPGDFLVFSAPMYLRLPADHILSFLWTVMLSLLRGTTNVGSDSEGEQPDRLSALRKSCSSKPQAPR